MSGIPKIIGIGFDGTIHANTLGWQGASVISGEPVPHAIEALRKLLAATDLEVAIFSARTQHPAGIAAMRAWLSDHGLSADEIKRIGFPWSTAGLHLLIDHRAVRFNGDWRMYTPGLVREIEPWGKP